MAHAPTAEAWAAAARAPFAAQAAIIDAAVAAGQGLATLTALTAQGPDFEPFARLMAGLLASGAVLEPTVRGALADALATLPAAGLARALGPGSQAGDAEAQAALAALLARTLLAQPVERLAESCVILRWLGRHAPATLADLQAAAGARVAAGEGTDQDLLLLPGARIAALADDDALRARRAAFGDRVLAVLASQPRSLSLARAEELLSQRIYTEPGHFLAELLQNADDAGARSWRVTFTDDAVEIRHDGAPFDVRDVVGVLSIGQTTKVAGHIGLFGVGFKSVYAVCERPRVYSDVFAFEIADVSLPRPLERRPGGVGTTLVLPLRDPADEARGVAALARRARALPAHVLLTLRSVQTIEIEDAAGRRRLTRRPGTGDDRVELVDDQGGPVVRRGFLVAAHHAERPRAPADEVLVAVALDAAGQPARWPAGEPSVFAFLPTRQPSGHDFLIHARFAVPVDRERIDGDDAPNHAALARAGALLGGLVQRRVAAGLDARPLMAVAPRQAVTAPFEHVATGFREAVRQVPWLQDAQGQPVTPTGALLVPDAALAAVLAPAPGRRPVAPLPGGLAEVARDLGAVALAPADLDALLTAAQGAAWLPGAMPVILRFLARERWPVDALRGLAVLPDAAGVLHAPSEILRADAELRALAAPGRALLAPELDADLHLGPLWARLRVGSLTAEDVLADLAADAAAIVSRAGAGRVLRWLAGRPAAQLEQVKDAPLVPDERGRLRSVRGPQAVFLPAPGPLGGWLRGLEVRPPLVDAGIQASQADLLRRLGVTVLDLPAVLALYAADGLPIDDAALDALHAVLAETQGELSGRQLDRLAAAAVFPTDTGERRPLLGPDRALVPAEDGLRGLLPGVAWLRRDLARGAPHVGRLPIVALTADHLARHLAGRPPPELAGQAIGDVGAALAFVAERAERISGPTRQALAEAPIWPARDGALRPLAALRPPAADPRVAAVYRALAAWPLAGAEAIRAATALGLEEALRTPDLGRMVQDLASAEADDVAEVPIDALFEALAAAGQSLPPSRLAPLTTLPLYPTTDGERAPLGHWDAPDRGGAHRVPAALAAALEHTGRRRLEPSAEAALAPLLEALRLRPAGPADLALVVTADARPVALDTVRDTLVHLVDAWDSALADLAVWPHQDGGHARASALVRPSALRGSALLGVVEVPPAGLLEHRAEADADALASVLRFRSPVSLLLEKLAEEARPGEPLAEQPPWLQTPGQVGRLLVVAMEEPGLDPARLPLTVDAQGCLCRGARFEATFDELATVARTPLVVRLADPTWAAVARGVAPALAPRLPVRSWLEALAEHATSPVPAETHPTFADPEARHALYRAVLARAEVIGADEAARAALGRACVLPTPDGLLRPANALLFEPGLPDLDLSWNPTAELPEALRALFKDLYSLEKTRLHTLVDHVLEGLQMADGDGERQATLLAFLARTLRVEADRPAHAAEQAQRFKLGRRIRVQALDGAFHRPKAVLVPARDDLATTLAGFLPAPPPILHPRYDAATRALIRGAGADADLDDAALTALLDHPPGEGREQRLACARYVLDRAVEAPRLIEALSLRDRTWLPDAQGGLRSPSRLYWPTPAVQALLGADAGGLYPAVALRADVPEAVWRRLGCRGADDARLADVLGRVPPGGALDEVVLRWLEDQIEARRLTAEAARDGLGDGPWFLADDDSRHPARTLIRDLPPGELGRRRGGFSAGRTLPRLVAALRIPPGPAPRHYADVLDELATAFMAQGDALLGPEPELADVIPRAWVRAGEAAPARGVVVADAGGRLALCWTSDPRLVWPAPMSLVHAARAEGVDLLAVHAGDSDPDALQAVLAQAGVPRAGALFEDRGAPTATGIAPLAGELGASVAALWGLGDALRRWPARWRADFGRVPTAHLADRIERQGRLLGEAVRWPVEAAVVADTLVVRGDPDLATVADALCRDRLVSGKATPEQVALVADLLACVRLPAMRLLLDAPRPAPAPGPAAAAPRPRAHAPAAPPPPRQSQRPRRPPRRPSRPLAAGAVPQVAGRGGGAARAGARRRRRRRPRSPRRRQPPRPSRPAAFRAAAPPRGATRAGPSRPATTASSAPAATWARSSTTGGPGWRTGVARRRMGSLRPRASSRRPGSTPRRSSPTASIRARSTGRPRPSIRPGRPRRGSRATG
ncbi:MAG: hypothetical protein H6706_09290 [Myxococcales bacterium]|nr:hypothetical protein [Myxococcales bacterium]